MTEPDWHFSLLSGRMSRDFIVYSLPLHATLAFCGCWKIILTPWKEKNSFVLFLFKQQRSQKQSQNRPPRNLMCTLPSPSQWGVSAGKSNTFPKAIITRRTLTAKEKRLTGQIKSSGPSPHIPEWEQVSLPCAEPPMPRSRAKPSG